MHKSIYTFTPAGNGNIRRGNVMYYILQRRFTFPASSLNGAPANHTHFKYKKFPSLQISIEVASLFTLLKGGERGFMSGWTYVNLGYSEVSYLVYSIFDRREGVS